MLFTMRNINMEEYNDKLYEAIQEGINTITGNLTPVNRLKFMESIVPFYLQQKEDSEVYDGIRSATAQICHECGEFCSTTYDERHDEEYIVCQGGSRWEFIDKEKGIGNSEEEFKSNIRWSKSNKCTNEGWDSEGISYFVDKLKQKDKKNE